MAGASGIGKSMLTMELGRAVSSGVSVCGGLYRVSTPGNVLIINAEDDVEELKRRYWFLHHASVSNSNVIELPIDGKDSHPTHVSGDLHFCTLKGRPASLIDEYGETTETFDQIQNAISQIDKLRLIIFDPMRRLFHGNEDSSDTAAKFIQIMDELAADTGATVLLVHHLSKASASKGALDQYAAKGSGAFTDLVRWQMNIAPPKNLKDTGINDGKENQYLEVSVSKNNYGPPQTERLFLKRGDNGVLEYVHPSGQIDAMEENVCLIMELIKSHAQHGKHFSKTELRNQKAELSIEMSQQSIRIAIEHAIATGRLKEVPRVGKKAKGKIPNDLVPVDNADSVNSVQGY